MFQSKFLIMVAKTIRSDRKVLIKGDNIDEIIQFSLPLIRPQSKEFYKREIRSDLEKQSFSWIDVHAGMKITYDILFITKSYLEEKLDKLTKLHYGNLDSLKKSLETSIINYQTCRGSEMTETLFRIETYSSIIQLIKERS